WLGRLALRMELYMGMYQVCRSGMFAMLLVVGGCAAATGEMPQRDYVGKPDATYAGLKGQRCAVLVWADWRTRTEYDQIQLDTARYLTSRLQEQAKVQKEKDAKTPQIATQFLDPRSVVRFQREHPELNGLPIVEIAPRLGVTRVIYVEYE